MPKKLVNFRLPPALVEQLKAASSKKRSQSVIVEEALREHFDASVPNVGGVATHPDAEHRGHAEGSSPREQPEVARESSDDFTQTDEYKRAYNRLRSMNLSPEKAKELASLQFSSS